MDKKSVLFVCNHNSARSQMAEHLLRKMFGDKYEVHSAGFNDGKVHPLTIQVLSELGIETHGIRSKGFDEFEGRSFDYVISVCDRDVEDCPIVVFGTVGFNLGFVDPVSLAAASTMDDGLAIFRRTRDEIRQRLRNVFQTIELEADQQSSKQLKETVETEFGREVNEQFSRYVRALNFVSGPRCEAIICIPSSQLENTLNKKIRHLGSGGLLGWMGMSATLTVTVFTATFKDIGLTGDQWTVVFGMMALASVVMTIHHLWQETGKYKPEEFVEIVLKELTEKRLDGENAQQSAPRKLIPEHDAQGKYAN